MFVNDLKIVYLLLYGYLSVAIWSSNINNFTIPNPQIHSRTHLKNSKFLISIAIQMCILIHDVTASVAK